MTTWRKSGPIAVVVTVVFLVVQLTIPIDRLAEADRASRFGWQMFSGAGSPPQFVVETTTDTVEVKLSDYLLRERVEIDVAASLPPHLCLVIPDAVAVVWDVGLYSC